MLCLLLVQGQYDIHNQ